MGAAATAAAAAAAARPWLDRLHLGTEHSTAPRAHQCNDRVGLLWCSAPSGSHGLPAFAPADELRAGLMSWSLQLIPAVCVQPSWCHMGSVSQSVPAGVGSRAAGGAGREGLCGGGCTAGQPPSQQAVPLCCRCLDPLHRTCPAWQDGMAAGISCIAVEAGDGSAHACACVPQCGVSGAAVEQGAVRPAASNRGRGTRPAVQMQPSQDWPRHTVGMDAFSAGQVAGKRHRQAALPASGIRRGGHALRSKRVAGKSTQPNRDAAAQGHRVVRKQCRHLQ